MQAWRVKAYFDSLTFPARAEFPQIVYVIPELSLGLTDMISVASVLFVTLIATRRGRRHRLNASGLGPREDYEQVLGIRPNVRLLPRLAYSRL